VFVGTWSDKYGETNVGVSELWQLIDHPNTTNAEGIEPPTDLGQGTDRSQRTRLGKALAQQVDRRFKVDGQTLTIVSAPARGRAAQFRIRL
jgi:putative DNA primase/helicase